MDIRERFDDQEEQIRAAVEQHMARMWTSAMGHIVSYDPAKQTASIQIAVKSFIKGEDGKRKAVSIPMLQDVPVQFPGSGGQTMTFPVKAGDEVLVNFLSRASDAHQQNGGDQNATDASVNSLSHARAILGFKSAPKKLANVSMDETQLRSDDGASVIGVKGDRIQAKVGDMLINVTPSRVDLGGLNGLAVQTIGGTSSKVFAII